MAYEAEKRVILSHQQLFAEVRRRTQDYAEREWRGLGSWRDADVERFIAKVVPVIESGQAKVGQLTNSYLSAIARAGGFTPTPDVSVVNPRGTPLDEVYRRPAVTIYTQLSLGTPLDEAVNISAQRLRSMVATDMQLAQTHTSMERVKQDGKVVGYQRVLSPGENCALCAIASTQRYRKAELMPIHANCSCSVVPLYGRSDPGQVINAERLADVQEQLKAQGVQYTQNGFKSDRSIRVNTHGEVGPVLGWADQRFTSQADI